MKSKVRDKNNDHAHIQKFARENLELTKKLVVVSDGNVHTIWHSASLTCHMLTLNGCCAISFQMSEGNHRQFSDVDILSTRLRALWQIANHDVRVTDWRLYERHGGGALHFDFVKRSHPARDQ